MRYSLINVSEEKDGYVDGNWMQDCNGVTLEEAIKRAKDTEAVNNQKVKVTVAVVEGIPISCPDYRYVRGLKRLG